MSAADLTLAELDAFDSREQLVDELVRRAAKSCGIHVPRWSWTRANQGHAVNRTYSVTIPTWTGNDELGTTERAWWAGHRTKLFLAYYAVHEVCHLPADSIGHGYAFKEYERAALAELGIGIRYMRTYPAVLLDLETGDELYISPKENARRDRRQAKRAQQIARDAERLAAGETTVYLDDTPIGTGRIIAERWYPIRG